MLDQQTSTSIPLVKDILDTFPDVEINDHIDIKMIKMHKNFTEDKDDSIKYTDDEIYSYIKFINMSCLSVDSYKHVSKYINKDNIHIFDKLFDNYDILYELFPLLSYETVSDHTVFNNSVYKEIKDRWIVSNMTWIKRYRTDLLEPYVKIIVDSEKYYVIAGRVYSTHTKFNLKRDECSSLCNIGILCKNGYLDLVKYVINNVNKNCEDEMLVKYLKYYTYLMIHICDGIGEALKNNHIEIAEYIINFLKSKGALYLIVISDGHHDCIHSSIFWLRNLITNIESVRFLLENKDLQPYVCKHKDHDLKLGLFRVAKDGVIEMIDFLIDNGVDVNEEIELNSSDHISRELSYRRINEKIDLLTISSYYGQFETVKYLIMKGINVRKYGPL